MIFFDSLLIHPSIYTNSQTLESKSIIRAFPNPAKDYTSLLLEPGESDISVAMLYSDGSWVEPENYYFSVSQNKLELNFRALHSGIYIIKFRSNKRLGYLKIPIAV